jgi:hypothetical protein
MDRPQLIRRLRIAASVFFAVVTLALCVLWVRSYWFRDVIHCRTSGSSVIVFASMKGRLIAYDYELPSVASQWNLKSAKIVNGEYYWADEAQYRGFFGLLVKDVNDSRLFGAPHWFFVSSTVAVAVVTWTRCSTRFTLRTLLIAITLVAVVLGLGIWAAK